MKKLALAMILVLGFAVVAQAQCETGKLLEKMLVLEFLQETGMDSYDMVEMLAGYAEYRDGMDALEAARGEAKAALEAAIAGGGSDVSSKMDDLMGIDADIANLKEDAISQAATLLDSTNVAKLYLLLSDLPAAKKALVASLSPAKPICPCPAAAACAAAACAAPALSPEEEVTAAINEIVAAVLAGNVDGLVALLSKDFYHPEVGDLDSVMDYIEMGKDAGYLDDVPGLIEEHGGEIFLDDMEIKIEDGEASVYPIDASSNQGAVSVELILKKEDDGKWRIVGGDVDGI